VIDGKNLRFRGNLLNFPKEVSPSAWRNPSTNGPICFLRRFGGLGLILRHSEVFAPLARAPVFKWESDV